VVEKKHRNDSAEQLRKRIDPDEVRRFLTCLPVAVAGGVSVVVRWPLFRPLLS
jgi:hypothetical protein